MIHENSRYVGTETFRNADRAVVLKKRERKTFNKDKCTLYQFKQGDRLDNLSYRFYGKSHYWWCILDCNPKYLCELDIRVGDYLLIPNASEVL